MGGIPGSESEGCLKEKPPSEKLFLAGIILMVAPCAVWFLGGWPNLMLILIGFACAVAGLARSLVL